MGPNAQGDIKSREGGKFLTTVTGAGSRQISTPRSEVCLPKSRDHKGGLAGGTG